MAARTQAATRDALEHALNGERLRARQCLLTRFPSRGVLFFGTSTPSWRALPKLGRSEREDLTLGLWIEIVEETR